MKKKLTSAVAVLLVLVLVIGAVSASAATSKEKLRSVNQQISSTKTQISVSKNKINQYSSQINSLGNQITVTQQNINKTQAEIQVTLAKIDAKQKELDEKSKQIVKQNDDLNDRLAAMYKNGEAGYLEVILGSKSFRELLSNIDMISRIYQQDEDYMKTLQTQYDALADVKRELQALKAKLKQQEAQLEAQKATLQSQKAKAEELKSSEEENAAALAAELDSLEASAAQIQQLIKQEEEAARRAAAAAAAAAKSKGSSGGSAAAVPTTFKGGKFIIPAVSYTRISSYFGYRIHPISKTRKLHSGIDLAAPKGSRCVAAAAGTVIYAGWISGYGNTVMISHGSGLVTLYGHNTSNAVSKGQSVSQGQLIAYIGSTGNSTGPHCHFEVRLNGKAVNPMSYLRG